MNPSSLAPELVLLTNLLCCLPHTYYSQKQQTHTHIIDIHTQHPKHYHVHRQHTHMKQFIYIACGHTHAHTHTQMNECLVICLLGQHPEQGCAHIRKRDLWLQLASPGSPSMLSLHLTSAPPYTASSPFVSKKLGPMQEVYYS